MEESRERIQKIIARAIATSPSGNKLCLIGGFRYRLLDRSARVSQDLDYHWGGDLVAKQAELLSLLTQHVIPEVRRQLGYEGDARTAAPADESDWLRAVHLAFWQPGVPFSRLEIPVEVTRIECHDRPLVKVVDGTVYLTTSDADMVESKVIALFRRQVIEHRDLCDLFLFADRMLPDSPARLKQKLAAAGVSDSIIEQRLTFLAANRVYHARSIDQVVRTQLDAPAADAITAAGGGEMILDAVLSLLLERLHLVGQS